MPKFIVSATLLLVLLVPFTAADPEEPKPAPGTEESEQTFWTQVNALYEAAKKAGDMDAASLAEWLKSDYESMGDWEYKVIQVDSRKSTVVETELNLVGAERWEVFWVREGAGNFTFFLKRPSRSYLRSIPLSDLMKLIPGSGGE